MLNIDAMEKSIGRGVDWSMGEAEALIAEVRQLRAVVARVKALKQHQAQLTLGDLENNRWVGVVKKSDLDDALADQDGNV